MLASPLRQRAAPPGCRRLVVTVAVLSTVTRSGHDDNTHSESFWEVDALAENLAVGQYPDFSQQWLARRMQGAVNGTGNGTNNAPTSPPTPSVCNKWACGVPGPIAFEAQAACLAYTQWAPTAQDCGQWMVGDQSATDTCNKKCMNCSEISKSVFGQCYIFLMVARSADPRLTLDYCTQTREEFEFSRCPSCMLDSQLQCESTYGRNCMKECGNYAQCQCYKRMGVNGEPTKCVGKTVLESTTSCEGVPPQCYNHIPGTRCGLYKHCPMNMCLVKGIKCPSRNPCELEGICAPSDGNCYYKSKDDGTPCNDGKFYTHNDKCMRGKCVGVLNYCDRDNVQCQTGNTCLQPEGVCDPTTGSCIFTRLPMGTPCSSKITPDAKFDGTCSNGLCQLLQTDRCAEANCTGRQDVCFSEYACNPQSGQCVSQPLPEGSPCDDKSASTVEDKCIDGKCVGTNVALKYFIDSDSEKCLRMEASGAVRYYSDVYDEDICKHQCLVDPGCTMYGFAYQTCNIYGTARNRNPPSQLYGQEWVYTSDPLQLEYAINCMEKSSHSFAATDKYVVEKAALLMCSLLFFVIVPMIWLIYDERALLKQWYRKVTRSADKPVLRIHSQGKLATLLRKSSKQSQHSVVSAILKEQSEREERDELEKLKLQGDWRGHDRLLDAVSVDDLEREGDQVKPTLQTYGRGSDPESESHSVNNPSSDHPHQEVAHPNASKMAVAESG